WGQAIPDDPGPLFYPVALVFRTTPLMWVGVIVALISLIFWRQIGPFSSKLRRFISEKDIPAWLEIKGTLVLCFLCVIVILLELTAVISKVDRFLLLIFPILNIVAAIGFIQLLNWLQTSFNKHQLAQTLLPLGLAILVLGGQAQATWSAHPYYFTYWNPLVGGGRMAMTTLPMGAGEGVDLAMAHLNSQPDVATSSLVCGASQPWCARLFEGETLRFATYFNGDWAQADYASFYISQLQRGRYPPEVVDFFMNQLPRYEVELSGATYMWLYDVPKITNFAGATNDLTGLARLFGYTPSAETVKNGEDLGVTVWWTNMGAGVNQLVIQLLDDTGYVWATANIVPDEAYANLPADQRAIASGTASIQIPPTMPPNMYHLRVGVLNQTKEQVLATFPMPDTAGPLKVTSGQIFDDATKLTITQRVDAQLSPEIALLGYTRPPQVLTAESLTWLTLFWQALETPPDYTVSLILRDKSGQAVATWQAKPGYNQYPTSQWQPAQIIQDVWPLQVETDINPGLYDLEVRLLSEDALSSQTLPNNPFVISDLEVWPQPIKYEIPSMQAELYSDYGEQLTLLGYDLYFDADGVGGGSFSPIFYWQSSIDFQQTFDVLLTLRQANTDQVLQEWRVPLGDRQARTAWKSQEVVTTPYQFDLGAINDQYHLDIRLEPITGDFAEVTSTITRIEHVQDKIVIRVP
ncbi:MAG: hypothetical protein AAF485_22805, partial [Chloroflexota bacterium]